MFDHFVLGTMPRSKVASDDGVCPLDTSSSSTALPVDSKSPPGQLAAPSALNDIRTQLEEQILHRPEDDTDEVPSSRHDYVEDPPLEVDEEPSEDEEVGADIPSIPPSIRCRRRQRQLNTQLQCSTTHLRSIDVLVDDMVATNSQCNILPAQISLPAILAPATIIPAPPLEVAPPPESSSAAPAIVIDDMDEGFHEPEGDEEQRELDFERELMRLRQADGPLGVRKRIRQGCTLNRPRIRRRHHHVLQE